MFALHAQHRELENRRKTAQIFYKKVAAKRFAKVLDRLGRKQSKQQIFPLFDALRLTVQADSRESSTTAALARSHRSALCRMGRFCTDPEAQHPQPTAHPGPRHRLLLVDAERFAQGTAARKMRHCAACKTAKLTGQGWFLQRCYQEGTRGIYARI